MIKEKIAEGIGVFSLPDRATRYLVVSYSIENNPSKITIIADSYINGSDEDLVQKFMKDKKLKQIIINGGGRIGWLRNSYARVYELEFFKSSVVFGKASIFDLQEVVEKIKIGLPKGYTLEVNFSNVTESLEISKGGGKLYDLEAIA